MSFGSSNVSLWRWNLKMSEFRSPCNWYSTGIGSSTFDGRGLPIVQLQVWGRGGLLEVLMVVWRAVQSGCGLYFQTCNRTHSDRLPVVDSPQRWGMVSCSWLSLSDLSTLMLSHWKRIGSLAYRSNSSFPLWSPFSVCFGLFIQDFIHLPVSIFFGLMELSEFCSEPWFVIVIV